MVSGMQAPSCCWPGHHTTVLTSSGLTSVTWSHLAARTAEKCTPGSGEPAKDWVSQNSAVGWSLENQRPSQ